MMQLFCTKPYNFLTKILLKEHEKTQDQDALCTIYIVSLRIRHWFYLKKRLRQKGHGQVKKANVTYWDLAMEPPMTSYIRNSLVIFKSCNNQLRQFLSTLLNLNSPFLCFVRTDGCIC